MPIVLLLVIMIKKIFKVDNTWAFILFFLIAYMVFKIATGEEYLKAFNYIIPGLRITFGSTLVSFVIALFLGLILGIGRISNNKISSTLSRTYIEFVRGVPILILIFTIAFVVDLFSRTTHMIMGLPYCFETPLGVCCDQVLHII